jgi:glycine cleavage system H protein
MYAMEGLGYTKEHEWLRMEGEHAYIGVTDYAQDALGDVAYVEMPEIGLALARGEVLCTLESPKAVSEVFSPVAGEVVEVNGKLEEAPEEINESPYAAWLVKVRVTGKAEGLMDAKAYEEYAQSLEGHE